MTEPEKNESQKQDKIIAALLSSESIREAAKNAGISEATIYRQLKDETFLTAYKAVKREVVNHAVSKLQKSTGKAVKALVEIIEDSDAPASARVSACKTILEASMKAVEIEDLEDRITNLEQIIEAQNKK